MRSRLLLAAVAAVCLPLVGFAAPAPAGSKSGGPPIVFQLAPFGKLLADVQTMATTVGGKGVAGMMDDAIKAKLGEKGWAGLDVKKPAAGYVILPNKAIKGLEDYKDVAGVLALPVTGEEEFKEFVGRLVPDNAVAFVPIADNKGLYKLEGPDKNYPIPIRARFHDGYIYIGINAKDEVLDAKGLVPVADLVKANDPGLLLVRFFTDRYPEEVLKQGTEQLDEAIAKFKEQTGGGIGWMEGVIESYVAMTKRMAASMKDAEETGLRVAFDEKAAEVAFESYAVPKKNTAYAKEIAATKPTANRFAALVTDKTPAAALVQLPIGTPEVKALIQKVIAAGEKGKDDAPEQARPILDELLKGLGRTVKGDSIDFAAAVNAGTDGHYTGVAAVTFDDASGLEKALKDALKDAPAEVKDNVKLDVEKIEGVSVHRFSPPDAEEQAKNIFGSTDIFVAFGPKGIYAAVGTGAMDALKAAITAKPTAAKVFDLVVNPKRLGDLIAAGNEGIGVMAKGILGTDDKRVSAFSVSYEGGAAMKMRMALNLKVIPKAMGSVGAARAGAFPPPAAK